MIEALDIGMRRDDRDVLQGATLRVARGEVAVLIGPSGSGKSTFLRCLNGLERFDRGTIQVGDLRLSADLPEKRRARLLRPLRLLVGMVFQNYNLFPHRTALGNVTEAPSHVLGLSRDEAETRGRALLERVGLGHRLSAYPHQLSGGEQQRVAIARALAMHPSAILFDEPTSALDPRMTAEVLAVLTDLAREGQTMVVVTHALRFARRIATTLHVLHEGKVVESGPPDQVLDQPAVPSTRSLLAQSET